MTRVATALLTALVSAIPSTVDAQTDWPVQLGQRVRVNSRLGPLHPLTTVGSVTALTADSLFVRANDRVPAVGLRAQEITTLEISTGRKSSGAKGAMIGLLVGGGIGVLLADLCFSPFGCSGPDYSGVPVLAGVGAATGLLIGAARRTEHWISIPLDFRSR